jgi:uncharacterized membrane protein YuzA (DUF378 family)
MDFMLQKIAFKLAMFLVIVGSFVWLFVGVMTWNPLEVYLGKGVARVIYILVGLSAAYIAFNRDTYLPFLGETVMPCGAIAEKTPPGATKELRVQVPPGSKVLFWAAEPGMEDLKQIKDWQHAYTKFENAGVTTAGEDGIAVLKVRSPQPYTVPFKGRLEPHVHFRICSSSGMLSRVKTVYVQDEHVEGFYSS